MIRISRCELGKMGEGGHGGEIGSVVDACGLAAKEAAKIW